MLSQYWNSDLFIHSSNQETQAAHTHTDKHTVAEHRPIHSFSAHKTSLWMGPSNGLHTDCAFQSVCKGKGGAGGLFKSMCLCWCYCVILYSTSPSLCVCVPLCVCVCVDLCRSRRASPKFRDAGLISCGSGPGLQVLDRLPAGSPQRYANGFAQGWCLVRGLPKSEGALSVWGLSAADPRRIVTCLSLSAQGGGEQAQWARKRGFFWHLLGKSKKKKSWKKKFLLKLQKRKDCIFIVSVSAFMWDPVSSPSRRKHGAADRCSTAASRVCLCITRPQIRKQRGRLWPAHKHGL